MDTTQKTRTGLKVGLVVVLLVGIAGLAWYLSSGLAFFSRQPQRQPQPVAGQVLLSGETTLITEVQQRFGDSWEVQISDDTSESRLYHGSSVSLGGKERDPIPSRFQSFVTRNADLFGVNGDSLKLEQQSSAGNKTILQFTQTYNNLPVFNSGITALISDGSVTYIKDTTVPSIELDTSSKLKESTIADLLKGHIITVPAVSSIAGVGEDNEEVATESYFVMPNTETEEAVLGIQPAMNLIEEPVLAYRVILPIDQERLVQPRVIVDASSGDILYAENLVRTVARFEDTGQKSPTFTESLTGTVTGPMYPEAPALSGLETNVAGVVTDGGSVYVSDNDKVHDYAVDGSLNGWLGKCTAGTNCDVANERSIGLTCTSSTCSGNASGFNPGQIYNAIGMLINDGTMYVADSLNHRVQIFDSSGVYQSHLGGAQGQGDGEFNQPNDVVVHDGYLYVSDTQNNRVVKYTTSGTFVGWFGKCTSGSNCDVANQRSQGFTCTDATCSGLGWGTGLGQLFTPQGLYVLNGTLYITESTGSRVQTVNLATDALSSFGSFGTGDGQLKYPKDVTSDGTSIFVADTGNDRITKHSSDGTFSGWLGRCTTGSNCDTTNEHSQGFTCTDATCDQSQGGASIGQLDFPTGVDVDSAGQLYVVESENMRVQRFAGDGSSPTIFAAQYSSVPFENEQVSVDESSTETQPDGTYSLSGLNGTVTSESRLLGSAVTVLRYSGTEDVHSFTGAVPADDSWHWAMEDTSYKYEASNVYYHSNLIRDYFSQGGVFDTYATTGSLIANVEVEGACNAYYFNDTISFYQAGGGCEATSLGSDIIYHEYTHGITEEIYDNAGVYFPYWRMKGAMNEAYSDYFAVTQLDRSTIGDGIWEEPIRDLDNTMRYPEDYYFGSGDNGGVHWNSPILGGALWNVYTTLGANITDEYAFTAVKLVPETFGEMLIALLSVDDNDGDLSNGTPNIAAICDAFYTDHGIYTAYCNGYTSDPIAQITSQDHYTYQTGILTIEGSAMPSSGATLTSYELTYASENQPNTWNVIQGGTSQINDAEIATWDTSVLSEGEAFTLRLTVDDSTGASQVHHIYRLVVNNVFITFPEELTHYTTEDSFDVIGTVFGADFESYSIEIAPGYDPQEDEWSSDLVTLEDGGLVQKINELLGTVDIGSMEDSLYALRIRITMASGTEDIIILFYKDNSIRDGWPMEFSVQVSSPVTSGNIDPTTAEDELVFGSRDGTITIADSHGNILWQYENPNINQDITNSPILADLNGDGDLEIIYSGVEDPYIAAIDIESGPVLLWEINRYSMWSPVAADIDGDGKDEVLIGGTNESSIAIYGESGTPEGTIPLPVDNPVDINRIAIGDIDNDGEYELVIDYNDSAHTEWSVLPLELDGTIMPGSWPKSFSYMPYNAKIVLVDVDFDGTLEILTTETIQGEPNIGKVYLFDAQGNEIPPWPKSLENRGTIVPTAADLDADGSIEIIANADEFVYSWNLDGTTSGPSWPAENTTACGDPWGTGFIFCNRFNYPHVIADLDNDNAAEVIVNDGSKVSNPGVLLYVIRSDGSVNTNLSKVVPGNIDAPYIADVDHDGFLELYVTDYRHGAVYAYDLPGLSNDAQLWPTEGHDVRQTNTYTKCSDLTDFGECSITQNGQRCKNGVSVADNSCTVSTQPCFLAGTHITMADGTTIPIEDVNIGDLVASYDTETGQSITARVTNTFKHEADMHLVVNSTMKVTPNHPVYTESGWQSIGDLSVGDALVSAVGASVPITSIETVNESATVYNLEVDGTHTYIADGVLVHNKELPQDVEDPVTL